MAGPGAVIKIDSFEGGALPPKAQIRSIRISRDQFAAENHAAGGTSIEIITQPGLGPIRYNTGMRFRDGSMSGRSPFTPTKGPEQQRNFFVGLNGTLIPEKSSFSIFAFGATSYETPNINVADGTGTRSESLALRTPRDSINVNAQLDYALTLDQTLRFGYSSNLSDADNLGIGEYNEEERAYSTENRVHNFRAQHIGPLGRRAFTRSRLQVRWSNSESRSAVRAAHDSRQRRLHARRRAGRRRTAGRSASPSARTSTTSAASIRCARASRSMAAASAPTTRRTISAPTRSRASTPSSPAGLAATPAASATRGSATSTLQAAVYVQDDIKVRRNLTVSAGGRYEAQSSRAATTAA